MLDTTYLLPIRAATPPSPELTAYLEQVSTWCPVIIVDGSEERVYDAAHHSWSRFAVHTAPDPALACSNGKVHGVMTALRHVTTPTVVIADDDVRYTFDSLAACIRDLEDADLVRPQNYFDPLPWHARWDTARSLLNRVSGGDFPGTLAVRAGRLRDIGGYDGDVLFENLELMRTIRAAGGRITSRPDLFVRRLPPTTAHFMRQRVRQAYDEFCRPARMVVWLAVLPAALAAVRLRRHSAVAATAALTIGVAEIGRRRDGGRSSFPATASLLAPLWIAERGVCAWIALGARLRGGVFYAGRRIRKAANSERVIRRRLARDEPARSPTTVRDMPIEFGY